MTSPTSAELAALAKERYVNLITFRKNGQPVSTPVWFAQRGNTLYVYTGSGSGKVKRIRNNSAVQVEPSTARGVATGPKVAGTAQIVSGSEFEQGNALIMQKYGWQRKLANFFLRFRKNIGAPTIIAITLTGSAT